MMEHADLQSDVLRQVGRRLEPCGWRRVEGRSSFARPVTPEIDARLDLTFASYSAPPGVSVGPYVAVAHDGVEKARKFITGRSLYTLNKQIQKLMEDTRAHYRWYFTEVDIDEPADRLVADYLEYAPPFYEQFHTLDDITRALEKMAAGKRTIMRQSLAIAYCLQGRLDEAKDVLRDDIDAARFNPHDIANEQLPKYTELFGLRFDLASISRAQLVRSTCTRSCQCVRVVRV
jgi:hypothetical protein